MDCLDYKKLYELQDRILDIVFQTEDIFYLTGGTALNRFYTEKRYSDDLDFFSGSERFAYGYKNIKTNIQKIFPLSTEVESKEFIRINVDNCLQVDFVKDHTPLYKEPNLLSNGYKIDSIENIFANKITAVLSRDNPKDIFDLFMIDKFYEIDYKELLLAAHKKAHFTDDELIMRLKTFPSHLLKGINLVDTSFLENFQNEFPSIIKKIDDLYM